MGIYEYQLNTGLDELDNTLWRPLKEELEEDGRTLDVESFFIPGDEVWTSDDEQFRIDCARSSDKELKKKYPKNARIYYLQLQAGSKTYANVVYSDQCTMQELMEAVIRSMENHTGVYVLP